MDEINVPFDSGNSFDENQVSHHRKNSPNKLIAGLIILFLIIALPAALFLSQSSQDIRQRASQTYPQCGPNSDGSCIGKPAGASCGANNDGICTNGEADPTCSCITPPQCGNIGDSCQNNSSCCSPSVCGGLGKCAQCLSGNAVCSNSGGGPGFDPCCDPASCVPTTDPNDNQMGIFFRCSGPGGGPSPTPGGGGGGPSPSPTPAGVCDGGCTWKSDNTCNIGTCLGSCTRRTQYCESNTNPGVNCQPDQCISDNSCNASCGGGGGPSPTPTPVAAAQCTAVNIYRLIVNGTTCPIELETNAACWVLQNAANPMPIGPGSKIYISTKGVPQNGATINQARIQVALDGAAYAPWVQATHGTTQTKPGTTNEYYIAYTIPTTATATTTFRIGAEVYSPQLDTPTNTPWNGDNLGWR